MISIVVIIIIIIILIIKGPLAPGLQTASPRRSGAGLRTLRFMYACFRVCV